MSEKYKIVITCEAEQEIRDIYNYIANVLLVPETAKKQIGRIMKAIGNLDEMPKRNPLYEKEPWRARGLRKQLVDNFVVFYLTNEQTSEVVVLRVFYDGRDIENLLEE